MNMKRQELELRFDPSTIEDLGIKMYSQLPSALAELVANAYDAAAENVEILLHDGLDGKSIEVVDDGEGMSYEDIQNKFLKIGRKQRKEGAPRKNSKGRSVTGRKGLGKLALFGIGSEITISSSQKGSKENVVFTLDWNKIINGDGVYHPETSIMANAELAQSGTKIKLTDLKRASGFDVDAIAISLSRMFNCLGEDFKVTITDGKRRVLLTRELRYENVEQQFRWDIKKMVGEIDSEYAYKGELSGTIISTRFPARSDLRGICLYANGRLVNIPGFFGLPEAEHVYSYLTGWIDADYIDEFDEDLTSTDRQSLNWDVLEADELRQFLQQLVKAVAADWNSKRKEEKKKKRNKITKIDVDKWKSTLTDEMRKSVAGALEYLDTIDSLDDNEYGKVVNEIYKLIPDYAQYHFRSLHPEIKKASFEEYKSGNYYSAICEACKAYYKYVTEKVTQKGGNITGSDGRNRFGRVFGSDPNKLLKVVSMIKRKDGSDFEADTINSLEESQMLLSQGIYIGFRNPISHELALDLRESGLITEQNCLDALSLLSMLFSRVDNVE